MIRASYTSGLLLIFVPMLFGQDSVAEKTKTDPYGDPLPPGAVARMGTVRLRHPDAAIAFSPDGKTLVSAGSSGDVRFWETATGKELRRVRLQRTGKKDAHIRGHKLSADGKVFGCWEQGDGSFAVYDTETGKQLHRFPTGAKEWGWVLMSNDGRTMAGAGRHDDHETVTVQVWDVPTGKKKWERTEKGISWGLSLYPDGRRMILGKPRGQALEVVDIESDKNVGSINAHTFHGCFSADGKQMACALLGGPGGVVFWDAQTLVEKSRLEFPGNQNLQLHAVSADGKVIACSDQEGLILRTVDDEKPRRLAFSRPTYVVFSPDGKRLAAAGAEDIRVFDVATAKPLHKLGGHQGSVYCVTVSRDGKFVASCASWFDRSVHVWDTATGKLLQSLECENRSTAACDFSADGKKLLTAGMDGAIQLWDWVNKKELRRFRMDSRNGIGDQIHGKEEVRLSPDSNVVLAVGVSSRFVDAKANFCIWDAATGDLLERRSFPIDFMSKPNAGGGSQSRIRFHSCFSQDGGQVTHWSNAGLQITETVGGRPLAMIHGDLGRPTSFSFDARLLAAGIRKEGGDPFEAQIEAIGIYESITGKEVMRLNTGPAHLLAFSSDSRFLAVPDLEHVRIWDIGTGKEALKLAMPKGIVPHPTWSPVTSLAFVPGKNQLVTGMADGTLLIWDMAQLYREPIAGPPLDAESLRRLWDTLQGDDARSAFQAQASLAASPRQSIPFMMDQLPPARSAGTKRVEKLIADLENEEFSVRDKVAKELAKMAEQIEPLLKKAKESNPSPEVQRRIGAILNAPHAPPSGDRLRALRAIAILERIRSVEARQVLKQLAEGDPAARDTREAKEALARIR
jgi:WD40 repeat protein